MHLQKGQDSKMLASSFSSAKSARAKARVLKSGLETGQGGMQWDGRGGMGGVEEEGDGPLSKLFGLGSSREGVTHCESQPGRMGVCNFLDIYIPDIRGMERDWFTSVVSDRQEHDILLHFCYSFSVLGADTVIT